MGGHERTSPTSNIEEQLNFWISQTESNWDNIPEFQVDPEKLRHLAVVCDGNRHSAQEKGLPVQYGHRAGMEVIKGIMRASRQWGIQGVTFWVWSTENWRRDQDQVEYIMSLAAANLSDEQAVRELVDNQVCFTHLGSKGSLPGEVSERLTLLEQRTAGFDRYFLNLAMNYGGRAEISEVSIRIHRAILAGLITEQQIIDNPDLVLKYAYTADQPLPDFIIRTGMKKGELFRTSDFLPIQSGYSLWDSIPVYFPDLRPEDLQTSIRKFLLSNRRMGQ